MCKFRCFRVCKLDTHLVWYSAMNPFSPMFIPSKIRNMRRTFSSHALSRPRASRSRSMSQWCCPRMHAYPARGACPNGAVLICPHIPPEGSIPTALSLVLTHTLLNPPQVNQFCVFEIPAGFCNRDATWHWVLIIDCTSIMGWPIESEAAA